MASPFLHSGQKSWHRLWSVTSSWSVGAMAASHRAKYSVGGTVRLVPLPDNDSPRAGGLHFQVIHGAAAERQVRVQPGGLPAAHRNVVDDLDVIVAAHQVGDGEVNQRVGAAAGDSHAIRRRDQVQGLTVHLRPGGGAYRLPNLGQVSVSDRSANIEP